MQGCKHRWRGQTHPQYPWSLNTGESAKAADDDLERFELRRGNVHRRPDHVKAGGRCIAEELQCKVNVVPWNPPHKVGTDPFTQFHYRRFNCILKRSRQFNGEKASQHSHFSAGSQSTSRAPRRATGLAGIHRAGPVPADGASPELGHEKVGCARRKIAQLHGNGNPGKDSQHSVVTWLRTRSCDERT